MGRFKQRERGACKFGKNELALRPDPGMQGTEVELKLDRQLLKRGWYFQKSEADRVCIFFEEWLRHSKGKWAGTAFKLQPWQRARLRRLFGWRRKDGTRRYRRTAWWVPRKNGKSTIAAGVALFLLVCDNEPGAEVYSAASNEEQAGAVFNEAKRMVRASEPMSELTETFTKSIFVPSTLSRYQVLSAKPDSKHGLNVHGIVIDELHALKDRELYDVLTSASAAREQPMEFLISTSGSDIGSFAYEIWDYSVKVRDGILEDPEFMPVVYCAEDGDDWQHESTWKKANPNYGVSVSKTFLKGELKKCEGMPGRISAFKQLYLNIWTQDVAAWLDLDAWIECAVPGIKDLERYRGRKCYGGLDLSKTTDLSAFALVFPNDDGTVDVLMWFWCPADSAQKRAKKDRVQYPLWIQQGHITATPGNVVDYRHIRKAIQEISLSVDLQEIAYDRAFASELVQRLQDDDGITMVEFGQGFLSMSAPTSELERLITAREITHDGNPCMNWMVSNVVVKMDEAGNIKPNKAKSRERIDGVVALIMALGRSSVRVDTSSVYETRGLTRL